MIYYDKKGYEDLRDTVLWLHARIAQLVEQLICNHQAVGSTPSSSSKRRKNVIENSKDS